MEISLTMEKDKEEYNLRMLNRQKLLVSSVWIVGSHKNLLNNRPISTRAKPNIGRLRGYYLVFRF